MEPVLSVSSFNEPKSEPLLQKVYRPVFSFENETIISFSFCCPHIPESLPQAQLKPNYLLSLICLFVHVSVILTALRLRCGALASLVIPLRLSCPVACGILVPWPGTESVFPALESGFLTTGSPGKSPYVLLNPFLLAWSQAKVNE